MGHFLNGPAKRKLLLFLLLALSGFGFTIYFKQGWGLAYGQTAGPTPTSASSNAGNNSAALTITLSSDSKNPIPGASYNYKLTVQNNSDSTINQVIAVDVLPGLLNVGKVSMLQGTITVNGQEVTAGIGTLAPKETAEISINVQIKNRSPANASLTNTATVQGKLDNSIVSSSSNPITLTINFSSQPQAEAFLGGWGPDLLIILVVIVGLVIFGFLRKRRGSR